MGYLSWTKKDKSTPRLKIIGHIFIMQSFFLFFLFFQSKHQTGTPAAFGLFLRSRSYFPFQTHPTAGCLVPFHEHCTLLVPWGYLASGDSSDPPCSRIAPKIGGISIWAALLKGTSRLLEEPSGTVFRCGIERNTSPLRSHVTAHSSPSSPLCGQMSHF